jgi:sRNA-binding regulator protein Hfq
MYVLRATRVLTDFKTVVSTIRTDGKEVYVFLANSLKLKLEVVSFSEKYFCSFLYVEHDPN